jgi:hypothetical protein
VTAPKHLLTLWNPSYAADPLDEHLRILLGWAERFRTGDAEYEEVYVWCGLRVPHPRHSPHRRG